MSKFDDMNKTTVPDPLTGGTQDVYTSKGGTFMMCIPDRALPLTGSMPEVKTNLVSDDGKIKKLTWKIPHNDGNSKNTFHSLNFKIPSYIPEIMKKYGIDSDNQVTEDAEFEIIQPKQLK